MPYDLFETRLKKLEAKTTAWREPPWILEFRLLHPRSGIQEEAYFRNIDSVPKQWPKSKTPKNWLSREKVEMDFLLEVKLRRRNTGAATKIAQVVTDMISQKWAGESPWRWYTVRDMLDAAQRLSGVKEKLRKKHPPDLVGFMRIKEEFEGDTEITVPLVTLEDWYNDKPDMHRRHEEHKEIIRQAGEQAGYLKLQTTRRPEP